MIHGPDRLTFSPYLMKDLKKLAHLQILGTTNSSRDEFSFFPFGKSLSNKKNYRTTSTSPRGKIFLNNQQ